MRPRAARATTATAMSGPATLTVGHVAPPTLPRVQKTMSRSSSVSAAKVISPVRAPAMTVMATPVSTRVTTSTRPWLLAARNTMTVAASPVAKAASGTV